MSGNSHNLKAVIFDYGEVLCHRPTPDELSRLARFFGLTVDQLPALWERNRGPYDRGDLASEAYWSMLAKDAGGAITQQQLAEICALDIAMWGKVNTAMVDWMLQLGPAGMKVGLLSNMHPEMVAYCRKNFDWLKYFDFVTFSAEIRLIKPDPAIYEYTLRGLGVNASETLFLDDREINIQAARALGIHSIRVQSMPQLRNDLRSLGFTILPSES